MCVYIYVYIYIYIYGRSPPQHPILALHALSHPLARASVLQKAEESVATTSLSELVHAGCINCRVSRSMYIHRPIEYRRPASFHCISHYGSWEQTQTLVLTGFSVFSGLGWRKTLVLTGFSGFSGFPEPWRPPRPPRASLSE